MEQDSQAAAACELDHRQTCSRLGRTFIQQHGVNTQSDQLSY